MHKKRWNALRLTFALRPESPLLVKSGGASVNPSLPDMQFVRTWTPEGETIFIPGSSLKGVFRSFSEKVLRTMRKDACDPLNFRENCAGKLNAESEDTARVYRESCYACKMYGHTRLRGRVAFSDAFPEGPWKTEVRYGVSISRLTGSVGFGPFGVEVLVEGMFRGSIVLENFELWQLGLIGLTVRLMNDGLVRVGFGKSRGLGEVRCSIEEALLDMAGDVPSGEVLGVGAIASAEERAAYGLRKNDRIGGIPPDTCEKLGIFTRVVYGKEKCTMLLDYAVGVLEALEGW